jgi:hypothetical protein
LCWHLITKILRNGPRAHFPFNKATARAMAKDAFINKDMSSNPFSILNSNNFVLMDVALNLGIELGSSFNESVAN